MSGIAAVLHFDRKPVTKDLMQSVMSAMPYYGRDGMESWCSGSTGLAQLLTHDAPQSLYERGPQVVGADQSIAVTADARLDNRETLCDLLNVDRRERASTSDSDLILRAYLKWNTAFPEYLLGDFAVVICDERDGTVLCVRDQLGIRPLYYYKGKESLVCATDIKGVLQVPFVPRELDDDAILMCRAEYPLLDRTLFRHIRKLKPATLLHIKAGEVRLRRYWEPRSEPMLDLRSDQDYAEHLKDLLQSAVDVRSRSVLAVGCHLSGGLDSSAVAVLTARALRDCGMAAPQCFSWSPPPGGNATPVDDERAYVEDLCRQENLDCAYVVPSPRDVAEIFATDVSVNPSTTLFVEPTLRRLARQRGVGVLVSGWGGDEFISNQGLGYLSGLAASGQWIQLFRSLQSARLLRARRLHALFRKVALPMLPNSAYSALRFDALPTLPNMPSKAIDPRIARLWKRQMQRTREKPGVHRNLLRNYVYGGYVKRLEAWASQGAQDGIAYRYPLLDRRIIEFTFALPPTMFQRGADNRYLFRLAMTGVLPPSLQWARKNRDAARTGSIFPILTEARRLLIDDIRNGRVKLTGVPFLPGEWLDANHLPENAM